MPRTPTTERGRQTRDRVVSAAVQLVRERGVAGVSLDDVERSAGVGRSQLYYYFDDRDDLMAAVVGSTADLVLGAQTEVLTSLDSLAAIDRWFAFLASAGADDASGGCPVGSLVSPLVEHDEQARLALVQAFDRWEAPLLAGLTRMQERGEVAGDVRALADHTMAALQGGLLMAQVRRDPGQLRAALAGARAAIVAALTA